MSDKLLASAMARLDKLKRQSCFDPFNLDSKATKQQDEIFRDCGVIQYRWIVAGNRSGKSQLGAREITWILQDLHPYFKRPQSWVGVPLTILVVGKSRQNIESELWTKKIKPFLEGEWKEKRVGTQLHSTIREETGDQIVFLTHADSSDRIIDNLQGYTAHYVWVDEMPKRFRVLEELQRRTDTTGGPFLATFTPKVVNMEIKNVVDAQKEPIGKKYPLHKLLNPLFKGKEEEEMQKLAGYPKSVLDTVLYGKWGSLEEGVYEFNADEMVEDLPQNYSPNWRHVESVDPAMNTTGYTLWAENPSNGVWYCIKSEYIDGVKDPLHLWNIVQEKSKGYHLVRRICDGHEIWFYTTAHRNGCKPGYVVVEDKNKGRKEELIKALQSNLTHGKIKLTPSCHILMDELTNCQWNEDGSRIINSSKYHCADTAQYFVDLMPPASADHSFRPETQVDALFHSYYKRKASEYAKKQKKAQQRIKRGRRSGWKRSR